ncbi:ABC transporter ATP-binding protein [Reyranella sp.]|uniref:ABC transporter ATP-binding protein n=1 Tax=Reyranella sp. TaxID=1929291 RepID=UPI0027170774|nr:ABC transporter ATP-binding protein [Reyranella sp.]MDO8975086.1 ABC transporter ATP-binding protein [Reyranella sp.]
MAALDDVSVKIEAGAFHALLGENGAGKSTLVKCAMGYYAADQGQILLNDREVEIAHPRQAHELGLGMVYQHFTLVPNMTVLENFVLSRGDLPAVIDWAAERRALNAYFETTPFTVPVDVAVADLAAGQKQKGEILRQLYLKRNLLILDEPTSVLTPDEADEVLTTLKKLTDDGQITIVTITHKFREVNTYCDAVTVLRRGQLIGTKPTSELDNDMMAEMMVGRRETRTVVEREIRAPGKAVLKLEGLSVADNVGQLAVEDLALEIRAGEIVGVAGVSGNGQRELVETLAGQRDHEAGRMLVHGEVYTATRPEMVRHRIACLPEEPLRNACVADMSVAENMALRSFDQSPSSPDGIRLRRGPMRETARKLIEAYKVKTPGPDAAIRGLSGGNVQRAVLARELSSEGDLLIVANPCFGLDFAAVAEIRARIVQARNRGAAVLLVSEDLDEILQLSDRIVVMFDGRLALQTDAASADVGAIGRAMAGH